MSTFEPGKANNRRPNPGLLSRTDAAKHGIIALSILLLLSPAIPFVGAQSGWNSAAPPDQYHYPNFNPSMAIIIVILIAALFFMLFFSIYIRRCSEMAGTGTGTGTAGGIRQMGASLRGRAAARGLDREVIETFPTFMYSEVKELKIGNGALECAVCLNEFEDDEPLRLIPKCDHVFHPECIDAWLESHVTCPVCRSNLVPQPGEAALVPERVPPEENPSSDDVSICVDENREDSAAPVARAVDRNWSLNQNRPPRSRSVGGKVLRFPRSHSTGHSLVQPGENKDRFTLRLPEEVRKQVLNRALNRTHSSMLPRGGSSRGARYNRRMDRLDRGVKSERWVFSMVPPFFSRAPSVRSPRIVADEGEETTSSRTHGGVVKLPSFKCLQPDAKGDEIGLVSADSARPPV